jgi:osmoprotectant transport system ATP-binding protein
MHYPGRRPVFRMTPEAPQRLPPSIALEAVDVVKRFDDAVALDRVSLEVKRGERVALVGESGSGKTTLLRTFNRTIVPDEGEVRISGRSVRTLDPVALRRSIGFVQQEGGLLPHWTVLRNASLVPWLQGSREAQRLGREALVRVGLEPETFGRRWPGELSGGQRQRVANARALAAGPDVVLLDEPFGALDAITRAELQDTFLAVAEELDISALLVTHDLREALLLADRIAVLRGGRIEQVATPHDLLEAPATDYVRTLLEKARVREAES